MKFYLISLGCPKNLTNSEEFTARLEAWSRMHGRELSLSWGCASFRDNPELPMIELAKLAERRMYEAKSNYYRSKGKDRRR